jgi:hypothetical protein
MFHNSLKHLVENIRSNRNEYVDKRKHFPKWVEDWLQASLTTSRMEDMNVSIGHLKCFQSIVIIAKRGADICTKIVWMHSTLWALAMVCTRDKRLLRVVTNECGQNGMASVPNPISAYHRNARFTTCCNWG